jgi:diguanylate cyclase (GGDEF)-like protein
MVGRYGGEEFLLVLSGCDSCLAQRCAEDVRKAMAGRLFETSSGPLSLSVSIGTLTSTDWDPEISTPQLLHEADRALYRAKANGRNRVEPALPLLNQFLLEGESDQARITS